MACGQRPGSRVGNQRPTWALIDYHILIHLVISHVAMGQTDMGMGQKPCTPGEHQNHW